VRRRLLLASLALLAVAAGAASPAAALGRRTVFGSAGELFTVRAGTYASLFPEGTDPVVPESPVLALEVRRPGGAVQRLLVPGTGGSDSEEAPSVVFEDVSRSVFVLWQSRGLSGRAELDLVRFGPGGWSEVIEVSGDPTTPKGAPQLAVTRRTVARPGGEPRTITVVNLVWSEPQTVGGGVLWAPIVLEDGVYLGWNPVVALDELAGSQLGLGLPSGAAIDAAVVDSGRDTSGSVAAFAAGGRLVTVEMRALPVELARLVDEVTERVLASAGTSLGRLAGEVRAHLVGGGGKVHAALANHLAELAHARILAAAGTRLAHDRAALAGELRAHLVGGGAGVIFGLESGSRAPSRVEVVELGGRAASGLPTHLVAVRRVTSRALPAVGPGPYRLFVSPDGERAILAWREDGALRYRETAGDGWTEVMAPEVPAGVDADELLRARLRE
jgi:hypothetical protein